MMNRPGDLRRDNFSKVKGLKRGIVKDLKDPDKLNRVKVTLIDEELETPFADVMASFAGEKFGTVFIPSVNEEVVLGFFDGQINNPVILGSLYNTKKTPPLIVNEKNDMMMMQFPAGLKIEIDNTKNKQKITITTQKGHTITLDDGQKEELSVSEKTGKTSFKVDFKNGVIELKAQKKISMSAGDDSLVLESPKGLTLNSKSGNLKADVKDATIQAKANAKVTAGGTATLKGSASVSVQSSGSTAIKGTITKIN